MEMYDFSPRDMEVSTENDKDWSLELILITCIVILYGYHFCVACVLGGIWFSICAGLYSIGWVLYAGNKARHGWGQHLGRSGFVIWIVRGGSKWIDEEVQAVLDEYYIRLSNEEIHNLECYLPKWGYCCWPCEIWTLKLKFGTTV
jgi:hypothetical protein